MSTAHETRRGRYAWTWIALAVVTACASDDGPDPNPGECRTALEIVPFQATAGEAVRVRALLIDALGVQNYDWTVTTSGDRVAYAAAQPDNSEIMFVAAVPGVYDVQLAVTGPAGCPGAHAPMNVIATNANELNVELRITPPASAKLTPYELFARVYGGADYTYGILPVDTGRSYTGQVRSGTSGIPARLLFLHRNGDVKAEVVTNASGAFTVTSQISDVLVIPQDPSLLPQKILNWPLVAAGTFDPTINVSPGHLMTGTVRGPAGEPLAGATVQSPSGLGVLFKHGPLGTTDPSGVFKLYVEPFTDTTIIEVAPPQNSGLPPITAFLRPRLAQPIHVRYDAPTAPLRDLAGVIVTRAGQSVGAARVVFSSQSTATVEHGAAVIAASGESRVETTTNALGELPSTLVRAEAVTVVVELADGTHAVGPLDLTSGTPSSIDMPAAVAVATQLRTADGTPIEGAVLDAAPMFALRSAGIGSTIRATSGAGGLVIMSLAANAHYEFRVHDPVRRRGASSVFFAGSAHIAESYALNPKVTVTGNLVLPVSLTPIEGAVVQAVGGNCSGCGNLLAEAVTEPDGRFTLVVPDPGTHP